MKTTVEIPDALILRAKAAASQQGVQFSQFVSSAIAEWLDALTKRKVDRIDVADARAALREATKKGTRPLRDVMLELGD